MQLYFVFLYLSVMFSIHTTLTYVQLYLLVNSRGRFFKDRKHMCELENFRIPKAPPKLHFFVFRVLSSAELQGTKFMAISSNCKWLKSQFENFVRAFDCLKNRPLVILRVIYNGQFLSQPLLLLCNHSYSIARSQQLLVQAQSITYTNDLCALAITTS